MRIFIALFFFFSFSLQAYSCSDMAKRIEFGDHLFGQKDYFRAVTVYKELIFYCPEDSLQAGVHAKIMRSYFFAGQYELMDEHYSGLSAPSARTHFYAGLSALMQGRYQDSAELFDSQATDPEVSFGFVSMLNAVSHAHLGEADRAQTLLSMAVKAEPDLLEPAVFLKHEIRFLEKKRYKDPGFAAGLSVIPGLGQIYAGDLPGGIGSMVAGGLSVYAGIENMKDQNWLNIVLWGSAFLVFYVNNFRAAVKKTGEFNESLDFWLLDRMKEQDRFDRFWDQYACSPLSVDLCFRY